LSGNNSVISVVCGNSPCSWIGSGFTAQDSLLWTSDAGNGGNGPITLTFGSGLSGAGAMIQADAPGSFTAQITAYNGANTLQTYTVNGSGAIYIGVLDMTGPNITSVAFSLTACSNGCNLADFAIDTVSLTLPSGAIITPSPATSSGSPFNFGTQQVGVTSQAHAFSITNTGTGAATITSIGLTGTNASYFSQSNNCPTSPATLAVNGTCTINVTFNPQAIGGPYTAQVALTDNASGSPQLIYLTGKGGVVTTGPPLQYIPVTPCRIADTRAGQGFSGQYGPPSLAANSTRNFTIPGVCGIPSTAVAYAMNLTVSPPTNGSLGYLTVWPAGQSQPTVSTLNSPDGRIKANAAIVPSGASGGISVYASDSTDFILDINGYFVGAGSSPSALSFYPLTPCRLVDTRSSQRPAGPLGPPSLSGNSTRTFPIMSTTNSCSSSIPLTAQAYSLNYTVIPASYPNKPGVGYLTTWPAGQAEPLASTLNAGTGTYVANAAIIPATGSSGSVSVFVSDSTDLLIDINGYFAAPGGSGALSLYTLTPCRVLDTRGPPSYSNPPFSGEYTVNVASSSCQVPSAAQSYVLNATTPSLSPPSQLVYLTLWADGQAEPVVSTLNALDGATTSNMAIVPTINGSIDAFAYNPTQLIVDISSYFAP